MKDWPTGSYLVLRCKTPRKQVLYAIGYKYCKDAVIHFIATEHAGSTKDKMEYELPFTDGYGNRQCRKIYRPAIIGKYFSDFNAIDCHNQARQGELDVEYTWPTQNAWFKFCTCMIGVVTTDVWKAVKHIMNDGSDNFNRPIKAFADILARQMIYNKFPDTTTNFRTLTISNRYRDGTHAIPPNISSLSSITAGMQTLQLNSTGEAAPLSVIGRESNASSVSDLSSATSSVEKSHYFDETDQTDGVKTIRTKRRTCMYPSCSTKTKYECKNVMCLQREFKSYNRHDNAKGIFYCQQHFHIHHQHVRAGLLDSSSNDVCIPVDN